MSFALAGCASLGADPPALTSVQTVPQQWVLADPGGADIPLDRYWVMLDDPLLEQFVAKARTDNIDLAQAITRLRAARAGLRQARADRVPTVNASGGARRDVGDLASEDVLLSLVPMQPGKSTCLAGSTDRSRRRVAMCRLPAIHSAIWSA
jgi:outer membrane protein TolC